MASFIYFSNWADIPTANISSPDIAFSNISLSVPSISGLPKPVNPPSNLTFVEFQVRAVPIVQYAGCLREGFCSIFTITQSTTVFATIQSDTQQYKPNFPFSNVNLTSGTNTLKLSLQPNPANDNLTVQFAPSQNCSLSVEITDALQRKVITSQSSPYLAGQKHTTSISIAKIPNGIYTVRVFGTDDNGYFYNTSQQLIISK